MRASLIHKLSSHCKTEAIISGTISRWYATGAGPLRSCFVCERGRWAVVGWERRLGSAPGALPPPPHSAPLRKSRRALWLTPMAPACHWVAVKGCSSQASGSWYRPEMTGEAGTVLTL